MSQTARLLDALKKSLRARGLTYRDVATALDISEASVKRLFSEQSFSVQRLEAVCTLLGINVYDLARLSRLHEDSLPRELSRAQEQALADDPVLLTYFFLLLTGWTPARIARRFGLGARRNRHYLERLAALTLVSRQSGDRVRLLSGRRIKWLPNGPVRRLYEARVKSEFLQSRFAGPEETMRLESGELTEASIRLLRRKMDRLAADFDEYADTDRSASPERKRAFAMLLAFRPWTFWSLVEDGPQRDDGVHE